MVKITDKQDKEEFFSPQHRNGRGATALTSTVTARTAAVGWERCSHRSGGSGSPPAPVCSPTGYIDTTPAAEGSRSEINERSTNRIYIRKIQQDRSESKCRSL